MKRCKIICVVLSFVFSVLFVNLPVYATNTITHEEVEESQIIYSHIIQMEDEGYIVDEIKIMWPENNTISPAATTYQKSATRTYTYYDKSNRKCWAFNLKGTFQYNGSSAKVITASTSYSTYVTGWKCTSRNASYSGNIAKGTATFKYLTAPVNVKIGLKCSASGTISKVNY